MRNVGTIEIERIIPGFRPTRSRDYTGRHRADNGPSLTTRATTLIVDSLEHAAAGLTLNALRADLHTIARAWRILDQAAYARIPKTWRHRLEQRANTRRQIDDQQRNTEAWWALRSADYPVLIPTQPMPTLEKNR